MAHSSDFLIYPFPHLKVYTEESAKIIPLVNTDIWTIGRDPSNLIVIVDKSVSRNHASLQILYANVSSKESNFFLTDLGSRNGTFVETRRVTFPEQLKHGDRLLVGQVRISFFLPQNLVFNKNLFPQLQTNISPQLTLTPSEEKIFWQVVQGFNDQEIIKRLQISQRVLQSNLKTILGKLNLQDREGIAKFALEHSQEVSDSTEAWESIQSQ